MPRIVTAIPNVEEFRRNTEEVARLLLGMRLLSRIGRKLTGGVILETEAYLPENDAACHGTRGKTRSNAAMFGPAGCAYVYPIHAGFCVNVVTQEIHEPAAVLIRSLLPIWGVKQMIDRRGTEDPRKLTTGPSRLCQALGITRRQDHHELTTGKCLWIEEGHPSDSVTVENGTIESDFKICQTERIGVTSAQNRMLRFAIRGNRFVSGPKRLRT